MSEPGHNPMLAAALDYAARGWAVFQCHGILDGACTCGESCGNSAGKHPIDAGGFHKATTDAELIKRWWGRRPHANIGIATGELIIAIDVDPDSGGSASFEALERELGPLPEGTPFSKTPRNGWHFLLKGDNELRCRTGVRPGIDVRACGGYIVAPPSSNGTYRWRTEPNGRLPELPDTWRKLFVSEKPKPKQGTDRIPEGQRNQHLTSLAGSMRRRGMSEPAIFAALKVENQKCEPPISEKEVQTIARSVSRYAPEPDRAPGGNSEFAVCLASIAPQSVRFLWEPYFPIGKAVMIEGDPGLGKSWLTCAITTAVSRGSGLPGLDKTEPQNVLMMSAEDGLADTIRPRLDLMGADVSRIFAIDEPLTLDDPGLIRVEACLAQYRPALLVIDPLVAFLGAKVDIHRANETRQVMARLAQLAERYECVIVVVRHLRKSTSDRAIYRGAGSIDFTAACRSVLLVGADPNDRNKRAMVHIKSNLAMLGPSIAFQIDERGFYWDGTSELTADDVFSTASNEEDLSVLDEAKNFLRELLANGPERVSKIQKETKDAGITTATLRRARKSLGVQSIPSKDADGKVQFWEYSLPSR